MVGSKSENLYEAKKGITFSVKSVPDIGLLENLGVRAGTQVAVKNRYALGGPVLLYVENTYSVAIGKDIAKQIMVTEMSSTKEEGDA